MKRSIFIQLLILIIHFGQINCQCSYRKIDTSGSSTSGTSAITAIGCVDKENANPDKWQLGDPFSFGGLDDFCIAAGISKGESGKTTNVTTQNGQSYTGLGADDDEFPILKKLVAGNAWSYNIENVLQYAYVNWTQIQEKYDKAYEEQVGKLREQIKKETIDMEYKERIHNLFTKFDFLDDKGSTIKTMELLSNAQTKLTNHQNGVNRCCFYSVPPPAGSCGGTDSCSEHQKEVPRWIKRVELYEKGVRKGDAAAIATIQTLINTLNTSALAKEAIILPYQESLDNFKLLKHETPDFMAFNPYFVETTGIKVGDEVLKNYLHFRVFSNRSVADRPYLYNFQEKKDNIRGRIIALLIMVKDQDGWPIGDFSHAIPCEKTCLKYGKNVYSHHSQSDLPCAYTPPTATQHPGMFVFPKAGEKTDEGFREVHATWSFTQDSCQIVTEIHVQTLIFEDFKGRPGADSYMELLEIVNNTATTNAGTFKPVEHIYGWSARYDVLYPTNKSFGAPDYVSISRLKERNRRRSVIDCHVPLKNEHGFLRGVLPKNTEIKSRADYLLALQSEFNGGAQIGGKDVRYFGQHLGSTDTFLKCRDIKEPISKVGKEAFDTFKMQAVTEYVKTEKGVLCPCPTGTTETPEECRTINPSRMQGRLLHGSHMAMAWLVLVPLAWFVMRFYKETFSSVFCLQEYWWFAWHVALLLTAAVFGWGGFLSVYRTSHESYKYKSTALIWHNILGFFSFVLFYVQICIGFFRSADPVKRKCGIFIHFMLGCLNQVSAVAGVIVVGYVTKSGMPCKAIYTVIGWIVFFVSMFIFMEIHIRIMDKKLNLEPPRTFLPPPVKRLFGQDAPGRIFRMVMLGIFIIGLLAFYLALISQIWNSDGQSCSDEIGNITVEESGDTKSKQADEDEGYLQLENNYSP